MSLVPLFDSVARIGLAILLNGLWQGALIALVTALALRVFARANASTRYVVWALALCAVIVVPIATSLSRVYVEKTKTSQTAAWTPSSSYVHSTTPSHRTPYSRIEPPGTRGLHRPASTGTPVNSPAPTSPLAKFHVAVPTLAAAIVFGLWLIASLVVLIRLGVALFALERLKRDALPLAVDYRDSMPRWDAALKGHRDVRLCVSDQIEVPVAIGLFDAMILLPSHLVHSLDPAEVDQISLHELAHLLRSDDWTNSLQRIASALLFFNPAVWYIARQMDIEREVACDDFVLQLTGAVRPYAFCLTKMAEMTAWPHRAVPAPGVFVTRKNISIRIERLLRTGRAIGSSIAPGVAASVTVALLAIFLILRTMTPSIAFTENASPATEQHWASSTHLAAPPSAPPAAAAHVVLSQTEIHKSVESAKAAVKSESKSATTAFSQVASAPSPKPPVPNKLPQTLAIPSIQGLPSEAALQHHVAQVVHDSIKASTVVGATTTKHKTHGDCTGCDYSNGNLAGKDFSDRSMEGSNFAHANLQGTRFDNANLTGVNFQGADLRNASFKNADLEGCNMNGAQLTGARFDDANLTGCNIDVSQLAPDQARMLLGSCQGCNFAHVNLHGMDLRGVHIEGANMAYADLRGANLAGAMFTGVNFSHAQLNGARVDDTEFTGCNFNGADLRNVDLSKASITGSAMGGAIMRD